MHVDERAHLGRSASSSVAKNTEAAFRISFARRSSKFSRLSALDLLALLAGGQIRPQPTVGLSLPHTLAQHLVTDAEIARDCRDRPPRLERQTDTTLDQLLWILPGSGHELAVSLLEDRILVSEPPRNSGQLTKLQYESGVVGFLREHRGRYVCLDGGDGADDEAVRRRA